MNYSTFDSLVAKKYAQAFIRVFAQDLSYSDLEKIENAQKFLSLHRRALFFLQLPQFDEGTKRSMLQELIGHFSLPAHLIKLFLLLVAHNRSFYIPAVLFFVVQLYKEHMRVLDFSIVSSHQLNEKQRECIKSFLARSTGKSVMCSYSINKHLIAGIRMQSVDYMWEYSVRKQLDSLRLLAK